MTGKLAEAANEKGVVKDRTIGDRIYARPIFIVHMETQLAKTSPDVPHLLVKEWIILVKIAFTCKKNRNR